MGRDEVPAEVLEVPLGSSNVIEEELNSTEAEDTTETATETLTDTDTDTDTDTEDSTQEKSMIKIRSIPLERLACSWCKRRYFNI